MRTPPPVSQRPVAPQPVAASSGTPGRHGGVGTGLPGPLPRSCWSFSTCGRLQGVSASEMAYFSTVFKTEATNCTNQRGRQGPTLLYLVLRSQPDARVPTRMVEEPPGTPAHMPGSGRGELWSLLSGHAGKAVLKELKQGPQGAGLLGGGGFGCGGWMAVEPPETLTSVVTWATLGRSPDLSPGAPSRLWSSLLGRWRCLFPSMPATGPHGILTSGRGPAVKRPTCR